MKKLLATVLLITVSWAWAGAPAQAAEVNSSNITLARKQNHHKKHHRKHHKKHLTA
jgi:hypothetical protein